MKRSWALLLVIVGCARPAETPEAGTANTRPDVARIFAEVSKLRKLPAKEVPHAEFLEREKYVARMNELNAGAKAENRSLQARLGLSDFSAAQNAPTFVRAKSLSTNGVYSRARRAMFILDDPEASTEDLEEVIAHESVHALQDQQGWLRDRDDLSSDAALARLALIEGDATLAMFVYANQGWAVPLRRLAERVMRGFAEDPITRYLDHAVPELESEPAFQRELRAFPYRAGAAFVAALLSTGGFELVTRAHQVPPNSTAQVLHPERYARGEQPIAISLPHVPAGYEPNNMGSLGELLTRSLLIRCNSTDVAVRAAEGWRGDAFVTMRKAERSVVAHQWVMDSESEANELVRALEEFAHCKAVAQGIPGEAANGQDISVSQKGARVVMIRGGEPQTRDQLSRHWLTVPISEPQPKPPLGPLSLPSVPHVERVPDAFERDGWLVYPAGGVELPIPEQFGVVHTKGGAEILRGTPETTTELRVQFGGYFPEVVHKAWEKHREHIGKLVPWAELTARREPYEIVTHAGTGKAIDYYFPGTHSGGRIVAISRCGGSGLLSAFQIWEDGDGEKLAKEVLPKLRQIQGSDYCERLTK